MAKKALLMILDGWGMGNHGKGDVIFNTPTPYMDYLAQNYPMSQLQASGENVGLPDGQMGEFRGGSPQYRRRPYRVSGFGENQPCLCRRQHLEESRNRFCLRICQAERQERAFDGIDLYRWCAFLVGPSVHVVRHFKTYGIEHTYVHCFMDGRDTDPKSGKGFIEQLQVECEKTGCVIASIIGRFYAMDRDKRWERVKEAYDLLVKGEGKQATDMVAAMQESYD